LEQLLWFYWILYHLLWEYRDVMMYILPLVLFLLLPPPSFPPKSETSMAYNNPSSWDSIAVQDDIYALLQHAANPVFDPSRFPAPAVDQPTPPTSESSPSPPSIQEREQFNPSASDVGLNGPYNTRRSAALAEEDSAKRKVDDMSDSDDSSYEQQPHKQHHKDGTAPRRSGGGSGTKKKGTGGVVRGHLSINRVGPETAILLSIHRRTIERKSARNRIGRPSVPSASEKSAMSER
jgi:hypothetical protein